MTITADSLLLGLKDRGIIPNNRSQLTDARFLVMADRVIESRIVPLLMSVNAEFLVTYTTTPLVASQSIYSVPYRSINRGLRELKLADSSGNVRNLALIAMEDAHLYRNYSQVFGFYFRGDKIHLVPDVPATLDDTFTLQFWYPGEPSALVASSGAALVTTVGATTVVVTAVPSTIVTGTVIDFVQGKAGNSIYSMDQTITDVTGTTITFAAGVIPATAPYNLAAGDYICVAGTSPVVNYVPKVVRSYFESLTIQSILESIGDEVGAKALNKRIAEEKEDALKALQPRVDGEPVVIINRNSLVRGRSFNSRRYYGN